VILAAVLIPRYTGGKTPDGRKVEAPIQKARSVECMNYLSQIRQAHQMASMSDENRPQSLADLRAQGVTESMMSCPVGKQPYRFDPASGKVQCVTEGHESY
jgi:hypothetical protein